MATAAISQTQHAERAGQRDRLFFSGIALLVLIAVVVGFARTYFLAGEFWANLANAMVHVHGALFTLWILHRATIYGAVLFLALQLTAFPLLQHQPAPSNARESTPGVISRPRTEALDFWAPEARPRNFQGV